VVLDYQPGELTIKISDDGSPGPAASGQDAAGGHGLAGMRERVSIYGGNVETGPVPRGGYRVTARLPLLGQPS